MAIRLDQVDQGIIETLQRDSRRPCSRIAADLGGGAKPTEALSR